MDRSLAGADRDAMTGASSRRSLVGISVRARTALRLGLPNIARVGLYRASLRVPFSRIRRLSAARPAGPFFPVSSAQPIQADPMTLWASEGVLFGHLRFPLQDKPPEWHCNAITGQCLAEAYRPWWSIPDFDPGPGDIKAIWELSRFDWTLAFAQRARNGDIRALERLNAWLGDWAVRNPPFTGPNWKCGQEASIRVMHLAMAQMVLGPQDMGSGLRDLITIHLQRIAPTTGYAVGQANNHGTSEAAALFVGGSWLKAQGKVFARAGRRLMENRVAALIAPDGSFSQYSVNYHRLVLATLCMVEVWRRRQKLPAFSKRFYERAAGATEWLRRMTCDVSGDAPNIGANDGAKLLQLGDESYRDHRPTVQLAAALFLDARAYADESADIMAAWLGVELPDRMLPPSTSDLGKDGGFAVLRGSEAMAVLRYPRFRFRPSQSDLLHLDFWKDGENLLRDGGTYSYNTTPEWMAYFGGVRSHNTVEFDGRDQMPRLGRFLLGAWPRAEILEDLREVGDSVRVGVGYTDFRQARHERWVELAPGRLRVEDVLAGFRSTAVLRWRLAPADWRIEGATVTDGRVALRLSSTAPIERMQLTTGYESRYYFSRTALPVLEVEVRRPCTLITECEWTR